MHRTLMNRMAGRRGLLLLAIALVAGSLLTSGRGTETIGAAHVEAEAVAATFGGALTGGAQPVPVETSAVGAFALQTAGGRATYTLALNSITAMTQAHIHQGAAEESGGIIAVLAVLDPSATGDLKIEGTLGPRDLIGPLAADWPGFLAHLEAGTLYVNVHTAANPSGELRGRLRPHPSSALAILEEVPMGASLFAWSGIDSTSTLVLSATPALTGIWWLGPDGWVLDAPLLPTALRNSIPLTRGTGILVVATEATSIFVPLTNLGGILNVALSAVEEGGVTGVATLSKQGAGTRVRVAVQGLPAGDHANHLHHGSCQEQGSVHVPLTELSADVLGEASATSSWSEDGLGHFRSGHYLAIHEFSTVTGAGAVIACGNLRPRVIADSGSVVPDVQAVGTVRLQDHESYDFSTGTVWNFLAAGDFYVLLGDQAGFWANNSGQLGIAHLGDVNPATLDSIVVPSEGYSRFGVPIIEGDTYVSRAAEGETDHFIVFRVLALGPGEYVEIEFEYR